MTRMMQKMERKTIQKKACFTFIPFHKLKKKGRGSWFAANRPKAEAAMGTGTVGAHNWSESKIRDYRC